MGLFNVVNDQAQFDAASNVSSDVYGAGIRFTQAGAARVTTTAGTFFNQGVPMSATGQVAIVDATAGLPAGTIYHNGLPINGDRVCVSRNPSVVYSSGLPFDSNGALVGAINFDLNFIGTNTLDPQVTFTRASSATFFDSAGVLQSATTNTPRFDYNPATLAARGLLIEEARTNSIRNNTMQGAVAGTPGTLPTNWSTFTALTGLTREIVGTGTENGITYIDIRVSGTPSGAGRYDFVYETGTGVAALNGQTWTNSGYFKLQAGTLTGITAVRLYFEERNSGGGYLTEQNTTIANPTSAALNTQRASATRTLNQATTAFLLPSVNFALSGAAIDITLRIGLPQLEQGAFATSVIPTTTTALTRAADVASVNTLTPWYNQVASTVYAEFAPAFQGSASSALNNPGVWGTTQNSLGSFNGYGVRLVPTSTFSDNINGVSRYAPSGFNNQVSIGPAAFLNLEQTYKTAFSWDSSGIAGVRDGQAVVTNTNPAAAAMGTHDQLYLGRQNVGGTPTQLCGYIRRITYYPRRLSNAELQALTT